MALTSMKKSLNLPRSCMNRQAALMKQVLGRLRARRILGREVRWQCVPSLRLHHVQHTVWVARTSLSIETNTMSSAVGGELPCRRQQSRFPRLAMAVCATRAADLCRAMSPVRGTAPELDSKAPVRQQYLTASPLARS